MYVPPHFRPEREALLAFLRSAEFGMLLSNGENGAAPTATHLPVMVETAGEDVIVDCHLARANSQWKGLADRQVLLVVSGPGAYVSPAWYDKADVPTWNYLAAHLQARVSLLEGDAFREHLLALVARHESRRADGIDAKKWDSDFVSRQMRGAVGLRLTVTRLEAAFKLSQNKSEAEQARVAEGLAEEGGEGGRRLARFMAE